MKIEMNTILKRVFKDHYKKYQGTPSCSPIDRFCEKCKRIVKIKVQEMGYNPVSGDKELVIYHRCTKYHVLWGRSHTNNKSSGYTHYDLLNIVDRDISVTCYIKILGGEWTFPTRGDMDTD